VKLNLKQKLIEKGLTNEERRRIENAPIHLNSAGMDDWGLDPQTLQAGLAAFRWIYRDYFRVETVGIENVPQGRVLLIANHGGQLPWDGILIGMSMLLDAKPARVARGMLERWFPSLPFLSTFFVRVGQMVGDQNNCRDLLLKDQCVLVFPEGVRGSGKVFHKRYQLQRFGTGFVRLALETKTPIVPVAVIGSEEMYPAIFHLQKLAKWMRVPYVPVTPLFPLLGPVGALPLPAKVTLRYGKPILLEGDPDAPESVIQGMVDQVKTALKGEIQEGLKRRGNRVFTKAGR
jgi:1-acyl-sn-glycerol-3-phosphate acyltransferase